MWSNWAGDQRCEPAAVERPSGVGELAGAVERAVAAGRGVRVAGSGHSFTAGALTAGARLSPPRNGAPLDPGPSSRPLPALGRVPPPALSPAPGEARGAVPNPGGLRRP